MEGHGHQGRPRRQEALRRTGHHRRRHGRGHAQGAPELQRPHELPGRALVGHRRERRHAGGRQRLRAEARERARAGPAERAGAAGRATAAPAQRRRQERYEPEGHGRSLARRALPVGTPLTQSRTCRVTKERRTPSSTGCPIPPCWRRWPCWRASTCGGSGKPAARPGAAGPGLSRPWPSPGRCWRCWPRSPPRSTGWATTTSSPPTWSSTSCSGTSLRCCCCSRSRG